jgi:hypothetical protein
MELKSPRFVVFELGKNQGIEVKEAHWRANVKKSSEQ